MRDQAQTGLETHFPQRGQQGGDFLAGEDHGQGLVFDDADFFKDRPGLAELEAVAEEATEGKLGDLHGAGGVTLVLAQEQEVLAELILGERGWIALEMLGQFAHVTACPAEGFAKAERIPFWWELESLSTRQRL